MRGALTLEVILARNLKVSSKKRMADSRKEMNNFLKAVHCNFNDSDSIAIIPLKTFSDHSLIY